MPPRKKQKPEPQRGAPPPDEIVLDSEDDGEEAFEEGPDSERRSGGFWAFFFLASLASVGAIGFSIWALRDIAESEFFDRFAYAMQDVNLMPGGDFGAASRETKVRVYFTHDGRSLTADTRRLPPEASGPRLAALILAELLEPPNNVLFRSTLPPGVRARGLYEVGRIAYVDLTREFQAPETPSPRGERLAVYALVNSIVLNDPEIDAVQIMVEGERIETAWGWLDCSSPLGANLSVIE